MTVIEIPDDQAAALKARAAAQGLTLKAWLGKLAGEDQGQSPAKPHRSPQEAAAHILELQKHVKPDPEGWTVKDYINYGRP
jgi:hypothetical protein